MNNPQPLVSIVTPVYNGGEFLAACIESAIAQTYENWELVIVDNCSTDETPRIIEQYSQADARIRTIRNPETVGALKNHNIAVRNLAPTSEYCKILHADDQLLPSCLEKMVAVAEAHPTIGMVGSLAYWESGIVCRGLPEAQVYFPGHEVAELTLLGRTYPFWSPSCLMHRTAAILERDLFYNEVNIQADLQCSYEILRKWDFGFVHEPLSDIRAHGESRTSTLANPMKKLLATNLDLLLTYGPEFIERGPYEARLAEHLDRYYKVLALSCFEGYGSEFWAYHRQALDAAGSRLSTWKIAKTIGSELLAAPWRNGKRFARAYIRARYKNSKSR